MNARLIINNIEIVLGFRELEEIVFTLEDSPDKKAVFHELAGAPSSEIRNTIASCRHLRHRTIRRLIDDTVLEVMRTVISADKIRRHLTTADVERYLDTGDCDILAVLARDLEEFSDIHEVCEKDWLCEKLVHQPEPAVRYALAENEDTPVFFLRKLAVDSDANVAAQADQTLREMDEEPSA